MTEVNSPIAGGGDSCPQCGSPLAKDQRYCLRCGARRGDPRLPFMDAVVFMDAIKQPQPGAEGNEAGKPAPAPSKRPLLSANASLVAGVATLVLAIGVGVLIGRSGDSGAPAASASPKIIRIGGSGGGEAEEERASGGGAAKKESKSTAAGGGKGGSAAKKKAEAKTKTEGNGATAAVNEVFESEADLAKPDQKIGGKCAKGEAGCSESGTFDGSFFGE